MRNITATVYGAFMADKSIKISNSEVRAMEEQTHLYLFDNLIAYKNRLTGEIKICFAGWFSNTTKERLRAFADITTKQGRVFVNGREVNSYEWILV